MEEVGAPASAHSRWRQTPASGRGGRAGGGTRRPGGGTWRPGCGTRRDARPLGGRARGPVWRRVRDGQRAQRRSCFSAGAAFAARTPAPSGRHWPALLSSPSRRPRSPAVPRELRRRGRWELRSLSPELRLISGRSAEGPLVSIRGLRPLRGAGLRSDGGGRPGNFVGVGGRRGSRG